MLLNSKKSISIADPVGGLPSVKNRYDTIFLVNYLEFCCCPYSEILDAMPLLSEEGSLLVQIRTDNSPLQTFLGRTHEFTQTSVQLFAEECDTTSMTLYDDNLALIKIPRQII